MDASLYLQDGTFFQGKGYGAETEIFGEFVFQTCHSGYEEVLTDPSYAGQVVVFTSSHIGNTGMTLADAQSDGMKAQGLVCKSFSPLADNHRSRISLADFLTAQDKLAISAIDTRYLTQRLRDGGPQMGVISALDQDPASLAAKLAKQQPTSKINWVAQVSTKQPFPFGNGGRTLAVLDFGIKRGILDDLMARGFSGTVFPWDTPTDEILAMNPTALFLSNGPGDPRFLAEHTDLLVRLRPLLHRFPTFGICLGHQMIALAFDGQIESLPFGHHAANHPVSLEASSWHKSVSNPVMITSQNHNYAVAKESIEDSFITTCTHRNDRSVAGIMHRSLPILSVQFHPEACPGPHDGKGIFDQFSRMLEERSCLSRAI